MKRIRLLLFVLIVLQGKYGASNSLIYLDSLENNWIQQNTVKTQNNESLVFYLDYNDCFNCNLLLNHIFKSNKINFNEINVFLHGIPEFKIKEFTKEYNIPKQVKVKIDNGFFKTLSSRNQQKSDNFFSGFFRIFSNGFSSFYSLKTFTNLENFQLAIGTYGLSKNSLILKDEGQFFTSINKVIDWKNNLLVLTNPNGKLLYFSRKGKFIRNIILNDTVIVNQAILSLKGNYSNEVLNAKQNRPSNILSNYKRDIKPLGFEMVTFSSVNLNNKGNLSCLLYVRIPIEQSDSQIVLDNALIFVEIDNDFQISEIYPVEIPKIKTHVVNDGDGFGEIEWNNKLISSLYSIEKNDLKLNKIGEWNRIENRYIFSNLFNLDSIDVKFSANFHKQFNKHPTKYKFDIFSHFLKFRDIPIVLNLKDNLVAFDNCNLNNSKVFRILIGSTSINNQPIYRFIEYHLDKIFLVSYNSDNQFISCNSIDINPKTKGLLFLMFEGKLNFCQTTDKGFEISELILN